MKPGDEISFSAHNVYTFQTYISLDNLKVQNISKVEAFWILVVHFHEENCLMYRRFHRTHAPEAKLTSGLFLYQSG